ncbi:MAG: hypothetical protein ACI35O_03575 [Bacillaceae bacterium]
MKRTWLLFNLAVVVFLAGCVQVDVTVDIDKLGNAKLTYESFVDDYVAQIGNIDPSQVGDLASYFDDVKEVEKDGETGVVATKELGNVLLLTFVNTNKLELEQFKDQVHITKQSSFFYDTYKVKIKVIDAIIKELPREYRALLPLYAKQIKLNLNLNIPIELEAENATKSNVDGTQNSYNWEFTLNDQGKELEATAKLWNIKHIALLTGGILLVLVILFIWKRKRK